MGRKSMAEVVLENVIKVYPGGVRAVDNVSLGIADREFIVLVGPSGCGKSTTLRMVAGLEEITSGRIRIGDRVVNDVAPKDRDIAMVFQNYALYPHMSVYKNMAFGLKLRRVPKKEIDEKVRAAAKMLGIETLLDRKPRQLSGGQRQRVAVGRAIVRTPKAFLFDEPLSNLDAKLRVEMRAELKRLHRRLATTTLYVTHDQEEAMTLGDRVVVMKDGSVQQCASPLEVYESPVNRFVAGFVGTPPMNFLSGRVLGEGGHLCFDVGSNRLGLPDRFRPLLAGREGQQMMLGIRPEGFSWSNDRGGVSTPLPYGRGSEANVLNITVNVVEPLGDKMDLHVQTPAHEHIVCRVEANRTLRDGMQLPMRVNMDRVHVFEPGEEGVNVSLKACGDRISATHGV